MCHRVTAYISVIDKAKVNNRFSLFGCIAVLYFSEKRNTVSHGDVNARSEVTICDVCASVICERSDMTMICANGM